MIKRFAKENMFSLKIKFRWHRGGILLTALLFMLLFSSVLLILIEDYRVAKNHYLVTRELYIARSMKEMFMQEYYSQDELPQSPIYFSTGSLTYRVLKDALRVRVVINQQVYSFDEALKIDTE